MTVYATRLENGTDSRERLRRADAMGLFPSGAGMARGGFRNDGGGVVTVNAGTMTVDVSPFTAWVDGGVSDAQGGYTFVSDATETLTVSPGHASLSRTDVVVAEVRDTTHDGSGATDARLRIVEGTPGAGAPALPTNALALRNITVPAGLSAGTGGLASGNLSTDRRTYTTGLGGVLTVASEAERDALPAIVPTVVFRADTDELQARTADGWETLSFVPAEDPWHTVGGAGEPTFVNSWGSAGQAVQFRKDSANNLHIRGLAGSGLAAVCFTLPTGYRPTASWTQMQTYNTGDVQAVVQTNGNVELQTKAGAPTVFGVYVVCSLT